VTVYLGLVVPWGVGCRIDVGRFCVFVLLRVWTPFSVDGRLPVLSSDVACAWVSFPVSLCCGSCLVVFAVCKPTLAGC